MPPRKTPPKGRKAGKQARKKPQSTKMKLEGEQITLPATIGGEHNTFTTLKKKAAMLKALTQSLGIVAPACLAVGINRSTHYNWMKSDAGYAEEVDNINELCFDFVESKLLENVRGGNVVAQIFYAKTKMKKRGYVERTEMVIEERAAVIVKGEEKAANKAMEVIHNKTKKTGT